MKLEFPKYWFWRMCISYFFIFLAGYVQEIAESPKRVQSFAYTENWEIFLLFITFFMFLIYALIFLVGSVLMFKLVEYFIKKSLSLLGKIIVIEVVYIAIVLFYKIADWAIIPTIRELVLIGVVLAFVVFICFVPIEMVKKWFKV